MWYWIVGILIFNAGFVTGAFWAGRERDDESKEAWVTSSLATMRSQR